MWLRLHGPIQGLMISGRDGRRTALLSDIPASTAAAAEAAAMYDKVVIAAVGTRTQCSI